MSNFKGFDDWIPIFRGGKQVDSTGKEHDGDNLIDLAVTNFDPEHHEPPVVVGHPKENAPAFGWIEQLKTEIKSGIKTLYARFKDVVPEFAKAVADGLYKKRSASFYPDGRLRHVGFLGAAPPAVKGLADLKFEDDDEAISFDFYDPGMNAIGRIFRSLRDWLIEKEGKEKADEIIPDWDVEYIKEQANQEETQTGQATAFGGAANGVIDDGGQAANPPSPRLRRGKKEDIDMTGFKEKFKSFLSFMGVDISKVPDDALPIQIPEGVASNTFTEADIDAAKKEAGVEARKTVEAEFAEKSRQKAREARRAEISTWCDTMVKEGKLTPAMVKYGVPEMLFTAAGSDDEIEFGEEKQKSTLHDRLKAFFESELPRVVNFGEIATRDSDVGGGDAAGKLEGLVRKKMSENKDLAYGQAFSEVQRENLDLAQEYQQEMTQGKG